jgi:uncharacterized protein with HEPN domain
MSKREDIDCLEDILEAARRVHGYCVDLSYEEFLGDVKTQDAMVRNIEIIGEAVKNLSDEIRDTYADVPWKNIAGMRDRLIHDYFGVNLDIVWNVVKEDIPQLRRNVEIVLRKIRGSKN